MRRHGDIAVHVGVHRALPTVSAAAAAVDAGGALDSPADLLDERGFPHARLAAEQHQPPAANRQSVGYSEAGLAAGAGWVTTMVWMFVNSRMPNELSSRP
jgi:hypothetical protein